MDSSSTIAGQPVWVDLAAARTCHHAFCDVVLLVEPMRRSEALARPLSGMQARQRLKQCWPMPQLSAGSSAIAAINPIVAGLSRTCSVHRVRLSRCGEDLARLLVRPDLAAA